MVLAMVVVVRVTLGCGNGRRSGVGYNDGRCSSIGSGGGIYSRLCFSTAALNIMSFWSSKKNSTTPHVVDLFRSKIPERLNSLECVGIFQHYIFEKYSSV